MDKSHKRLEVWLQSIELAKSVYHVTRKFPSEERYGLVSQMRRAAVSVPSNIAEGSARQTNKDAMYLFVVARGSLSELDTQMELSHSLKMMDDIDYQLLTTQINSVDSLLSGLIRYRRSKVR